MPNVCVVDVLVRRERHMSLGWRRHKEWFGLGIKFTSSLNQWEHE